MMMMMMTTIMKQHSALMPQLGRSCCLCSLGNSSLQETFAFLGQQIVYFVVVVVLCFTWSVQKYWIAGHFSFLSVVFLCYFFGQLSRRMRKVAVWCVWCIMLLLVACLLLGLPEVMFTPGLCKPYLPLFCVPHAVPPINSEKHSTTWFTYAEIFYSLPCFIPNKLARKTEICW